MINLSCHIFSNVISLNFCIHKTPAAHRILFCPRSSAGRYHQFVRWCSMNLTAPHLIFECKFLTDLQKGSEEKVSSKSLQCMSITHPYLQMSKISNSFVSNSLRFYLEKKETFMKGN